MNTSNEALTSVAKAAARLGISSKSARRHLPTVRIGGRVLVRISDIEAKIGEGRVDVV